MFDCRNQGDAQKEKNTRGRLLIYVCNSLKRASSSAPNGSCYSCGAEE